MNNSGDSGDLLYLSWYRSGNFQFFKLLGIMFAVIMVFTMMSHFSLSIFWDLIINGYWIYQKLFSASIGMIILVLFNVNMLYHFDWFGRLYWKIIISLDKCHYEWWYMTFNVLLANLFVRILLRIFCISSSVILSYKLPFVWYFCSIS